MRPHVPPARGAGARSGDDACAHTRAARRGDNRRERRDVASIDAHFTARVGRVERDNRSHGRTEIHESDRRTEAGGNQGVERKADGQQNEGGADAAWRR